MKSIQIKKRLGEIFITLSITIILFIYYPVISAYLLPPPQIKIDSKSYVIEIPKIKLISPIIKNVDPFNEKEYREVLKKGVARAKGTVDPGQKGLIYIFGHSSDYPWNLTRYNTIFLRIGELNNGDSVIIRKDGKEYKYTVFDKKIVWPGDIKYLTQNKNNELILQTCTPIGTALQRLLIFARPM
ncbi:MAG: sortase [Patescibacteria group bacterium]|nr:sortase [Patescibacteria group bacterium]